MLDRSAFFQGGSWCVFLRLALTIGWATPQSLTSIQQPEEAHKCQPSRNPFDVFRQILCESWRQNRRKVILSVLSVFLLGPLFGGLVALPVWSSRETHT